MMRRSEKRDKIEETINMKGLLKVINHFFPDFFKILGKVMDPRDTRYIKYKLKTILLTRILSAIFSIESMRSMTEQFSNTNAINNLAILSNDKELTEIPYWETINNCLERLPPEELERVNYLMTKHLIRMRTFEKSRIEGKWWQIIVDGTGWFSTSKPHCKHCLTKTYRNTDGSIKYVVYYHYLLEAKLVLGDDIVVCFATEFLENESPDVSKQDCELNAFKRLVKKIKEMFPRLPICISVDSLYAGKPFFDLCESNGWKYIVSFKDGSIPSVAEEFNKLKDFDNNVTYETVSKDGCITQKSKFVNDIDYDKRPVSVIECNEKVVNRGKGKNKGKETETNFTYLTNIRITKRNHGRIIAYGRRRWKIENQGFNQQKNHGYYMQHLFSHDFTAMKNHYYIIQIAHTIAQLFENGSGLLKESKLSIKQIHRILLVEFLTQVLTQTDLNESHKRVHYVFAYLDYTPGKVVMTS